MKGQKHGAKPKGPTAQKAKAILHDGEVQGTPLTPKQRRFMGARAGGAPMKGPAKGGMGVPSRVSGKKRPM